MSGLRSSRWFYMRCSGMKVLVKPTQERAQLVLRDPVSCPRTVATIASRISWSVGLVVSAPTSTIPFTGFG